jgi:hypothetical protein
MLPNADRPADQLLVMPVAVDVGGIEQVDPEIQRTVDGRDPVLVTGGAVRTRHRHAAQADRRNLRADPTKLAHFHYDPPFSLRTWTP